MRKTCHWKWCLFVCPMKQHRAHIIADRIIDYTRFWYYFGMFCSAMCHADDSNRLSILIVFNFVVLWNESVLAPSALKWNYCTYAKIAEVNNTLRKQRALEKSQSIITSTFMTLSKKILNRTIFFYRRVEALKNITSVTLTFNQYG